MVRLRYLTVRVHPQCVSHQLPLMDLKFNTVIYIYYTDFYIITQCVELVCQNVFTTTIVIKYKVKRFAIGTKF